MRLKTIIILIIVLSISSCAASATPYFNEVGFVNEEFIEIYSDEFLNLSSGRVYDDTYPDRYNELELYQNKNSSFYLIVGSKFQDKHNLLALNCTIYLTDKTQVSNGGLKDSGENFIVQINESYNLTYNNNSTNFNFLDNESLNYNINTNSFYIQNQSPCLENFEIIDIISNNTENNNSCNHKFDIIIEEKIFTDKIEFSFDTDSKNYSIMYKILNLKNEVVRNEVTTKNTNPKTYTPDKLTDVYNISANLIHENCNYSKYELVTFYSNISQKENIQITNSNPNEENKNSYIKILNKESAQDFIDSFLEIETMKGDDTTKRTVYIYHNSKVIGKLSNLKKYEKTNEKIEFDIKEGINKFLITGLGIEEEFYIYKEFEPKIVIENNFLINEEKEYFNISEINFNSNNLYFFVNTNIENLIFSCYILEKLTRVSNTLNISSYNFSILSIQINDSNLKTQKTNLKLICKYKKKENKTFKSVSKNFKYDKKQTNEINLLHNISYYSSFEKNISNEIFLEKTNLDSDNHTIFLSKNIKTKENSYFPMLIGATVLLIPLIIKV